MKTTKKINEIAEKILDIETLETAKAEYMTIGFNEKAAANLVRLMMIRYRLTQDISSTEKAELLAKVEEMREVMGW